MSARWPASCWAVDADTGKACEGFGKSGELDVNQWNTVNNVFPMSQLQPPTVYKNMLFVGWAGKDWAFAKTPPGIVFALDAQSGALKWQFNPLTPEMEKRTGKVNVWESMTVDAEQGLLYFSTSPPSPDDYGGDRKEKIPYANAVVALKADTGDVVWSRQLGPSRALGLRHQFGADAARLSRKTGRPFRRSCKQPSRATFSCSTG